MARMPLRQYARERGVEPGAIRFACKQGVIDRDAHGRIDVEQADATWFAQHQARRAQQVATVRRNRTLVETRYETLVAKTALARHKLAELEASMVDRATVAAQAHAEIDLILAGLCSLPAALLADELGMPLEKARHILAEFVALTLTELGDLHAGVDRAAGKVSQES